MQVYNSFKIQFITFEDGSNQNGFLGKSKCFSHLNVKENVLDKIDGKYQIYHKSKRQ